MKWWDGFLSVLTVVVIVFCVVGIVGCEDDDDDLSVSPTAIRIDNGMVTNVEVRASGGSGGYTWSVNDGSLGSIVGAGGTAIYTSTSASGVNFILLMDSQSNSVSATVTQSPAPPPDTNVVALVAQ